MKLLYLRKSNKNYWKLNWTETAYIMATWFTGLRNTAFYVTGNVKNFCKIRCLGIISVQLRILSAEDAITKYDTKNILMDVRVQNCRTY
jgi:hypothetical protein